MDRPTQRPHLASRTVPVLVEQHPEEFTAYPLWDGGAVVGEGETLVAALADLDGALAFHVETFGVPEFEGVPLAVAVEGIDIETAR